MGSRMASRLIQAGFQVAVWNRTASACEELIDIGAHALDLSNIGQYPLILTCLADDKAVQAVFDQIQTNLKRVRSLWTSQVSLLLPQKYLLRLLLHKM